MKYRNINSHVRKSNFHSTRGSSSQDYLPHIGRYRPKSYKFKKQPTVYKPSYSQKAKFAARTMRFQTGLIESRHYSPRQIYNCFINHTLTGKHLEDLIYLYGEHILFDGKKHPKSSFKKPLEDLPFCDIWIEDLGPLEIKMMLKQDIVPVNKDAVKAIQDKTLLKKGWFVAIDPNNLNVVVHKMNSEIEYMGNTRDGRAEIKMKSPAESSICLLDYLIADQT